MSLPGNQPQHFASPQSHSASSGAHQSPDEVNNLRHANGQWDGNESNGEDEQDGSRKRKRSNGPVLEGPTPVSCEMCKQRKVRCDRGQPDCGWCVRNGHVCEYKPRKKPGLRAGYGRELESRLDRLEELVRIQQTTITQLASAQGTVIETSTAPPTTSDVQTVFRTPAPLQKPHIPGPETALFLQKPSSFNAAPTIAHDYRTNLNGGQTSLHSGSRTNSLQQNISGEPLHPQGARNHPRSSRDSYGQVPDPILESSSLNIRNSPPASDSMEGDLPPQDLVWALTTLFFHHVNTWCPIFVRRQLSDSLFGSKPLNDDDRIMLHAIVATSLRFSTDPRLTPERRTRYHSISKEKVLLYGLENSSVRSLQALVILALDVVGSSNGPPGWNLLALITRSVVQLGLAVEPNSSTVVPAYPSIYTLRAMVLPGPIDFHEEECRRRLFWMIYLLDRYATIATAFEFALDEKEIDRKLPCHEQFFENNQRVETRWFRSKADPAEVSEDRPDNLGVFSYYVELIGILSQIHQFLKKPVDIGAQPDVDAWRKEYKQLDSAIQQWYYRVPAEIRNISCLYRSDRNPRNAQTCPWVMLHAAHQTTIIRLHSSAAYPTTRSPKFQPSRSAADNCVTAAQRIVDLCTYVRDHQLLDKLGPPFVFSVWVAARLILVDCTTRKQGISTGIWTLVETLRTMGKYWQVAERYADLLQRVLDEYQDSLHAPPGPDGERTTPSAVKILADMRRTAFDSDFLISRQPREPTRNGSMAGAGTYNVSGGAQMRALAPNELDYLEIYDFNWPPFPPHVDMGQNEFNSDPFPFPNEDWIFNAPS
ncbi:hypothetical protein P152DRAFT_401079 [Eremomyces bilateralis CBS 781.70]|uniref:Zn(2)-C6 fungal-type domain-containing protein n=1 Tax=Eremomyces bilateralis CBS 781.70 TaxID=1392243 RepID=A0A6G1FY65_9PEZI|nr:uncharacterized protein P152DRAFT_401079 [Eremomyces bilateralis CBS 781.70]KAF1810714.1 hypothetical protein P152DRAFT_401079 [Eremomyces bilateralis CBS 781.70]